MGFEELKKRIFKETKQKEEAMIAEAKAHAEQLKKDAEARGKEYREALMRKTEEEISLMEKREVSSAHLEQKKKELKAKETVIDEVFEEAAVYLDKKMTPAQRKKIISNLLKQAKSQIDIGRIYCNKKDMKYVGKDAKEADILGGFIAETKDGKVSLDYSFETLLESARGEHLQEITALLFGENDTKV